MTKKELLVLQREKEKLDKTLGGIRDMSRVPSAVWIVDTKKEHIAVGEARKLDIPVVAILDTNCDPDEVDYKIPGNDDAIRSVGLLTRVIADAVADGLMARAGAARGDAKPAEGELATDEPLADWERELLERRGPTAEATCSRRARGRRAVIRPETRPPGLTLRRPHDDETRDSSMPDFTAADVKKLRDATGAGMMDAKRALEEADGDFDAAIEVLRVKGQAKVAKRGAERTTGNGLVAAAEGAMIELGCETDFVAKNEAVPDPGRRHRRARRGDRHRRRPRSCSARRSRTARPSRRASRRCPPSSARSSSSSGPPTSRAMWRPTCTARPPTCPRSSASSCSSRGDDAEAARGAAMQVASMKAVVRHPRRGLGRSDRDREAGRRGQGP